MFVGFTVGLDVGAEVGTNVGLAVGDAVGLTVGLAVGLEVGLTVEGFILGLKVGLAVGLAVGFTVVGFEVGTSVGFAVLGTHMKRTLLSAASNNLLRPRPLFPFPLPLFPELPGAEVESTLLTNSAFSALLFSLELPGASWSPFPKPLFWFEFEFRPLLPLSSPSNDAEGSADATAGSDVASSSKPGAEDP